MLVNFILCVWVLSLTYASTAYVASLGAIEARFHIGQEGELGISFDRFCEIAKLKTISSR